MELDRRNHFDGHEGDRAALAATAGMSYMRYRTQVPMFFVPAYYQAEIDLPVKRLDGRGVAVQLSLSSSGNFYVSPGAYMGTPGGSLAVGWLFDNTPDNVDQFLTGPSYNGTYIVPCEANLGVGGGISRSSGQTSPFLAAGTGGATLSATYGVRFKRRVF